MSEEQIGYSSLSLSQKSYLISEALRSTSRSLFTFFAGIVGYMILGTVALYYGEINFAKFFIPYTTIVLSIPVIYYFNKARGYYRLQKEWAQEYLKSTYILVFNTTVPRGTTTAEKILNLSTLIFPELRPDYIEFSPDWLDSIKWFFKR